MKLLRVKHYGYILCTIALLLVSVFAIFTGIRTASAEESQVTITSPKPNQELAYKAQTIRGKAPAQKKIKVYNGVQYIGETTSNNGGDWSIEWKKVTPGEHQLRAYLVDGSLYKTSAISENSATAVNLNNGQTITNYKAGFALPEGVVYDQPGNSVYVLNKMNHTVSVMNADTNALTDTISYATGEALAPTQYDESSCRCQNYTYEYDAENRQLFIFDLERIYVISTQTNQLVRTIPVEMPVQEGEDNGQGVVYKLYVDRQTDYVYFYVAENVYEDQPIQRYSKNNGQKDQNFEVTGRRIVGGANGDMYFINRTGLSAENAEGSLLYKYENSGGDISRIDLSSMSCQTADVKNLAASTSYDFVYVGCYDGPGENFPSKQIAINTEDGSLADVSLTNEVHIEWVTQGDLVANQFVVTAGDGSGGVLIKSLNASDNTVQPDVEVPAYGKEESEVKNIVKRTLAIDQNGHFKLYTPNGSAEEASFSISTVNSQTGQFTSRVYFKYPWTTAEHEVLHGAAVVSTVFDTKKPALLNNGDAFYVSAMPGSILQKYSQSGGNLSPIQRGVGPATTAYSSKTAHRLFTLNDTTAIEEGEPLPFISNRIVVSNLQTGQYEQSLSLGLTQAIRSAYMDNAGEKLYLFVSDLQEGLFDTDKISIYRLDTQTLTIDRTFEDIDFESDTPLFDLLFLDQANVGIIGNELIFANNELTAVHFLNVNTGAVRTYDNSYAPDYTGSVTYSGRGKVPFAIDPLGKYIAIMHRNSEAYEIKTINIDDLTVESTTPTAALLPMTMTFNTAGDLIVGEVAMGSGMSFTFAKVSPITGEVSGRSSIINSLYRLLLSQDISDVQFCFPANARPLKEGGNYIAASLTCQNVSSAPYSVKTHSIVIDGESLTILNALEVGSTAPVDTTDLVEVRAYQTLDMMRAKDADTVVSKATQNVKVIADKISILKPEVGKKIKAGKYTITGTATPEQTLAVKVDGSSIGNVTADEFGLWEKRHTFTGNEKKVEAAFTSPAYDKAFLHLVNIDLEAALESNMPSFSSAINFINVSKKSAEKNIFVPDGMLAASSNVSPENGKLYVAGFTLDGSVSLLTYDVKTNKLLSSIDLTDNIEEALTGVAIDSSGILIPMSVSRDGSLLYVFAGTALLFIDTQTGSVVENYGLGQEFADQGIEGDDVLLNASAPIISQKNNTAIVPYLNGRGMAIVNLENGDVDYASLPEEVRIQKMLVDEDRGMSYMYAQLQEGENPVYGVTAYSHESQNTVWTTELEGYLGLMPDAVLSPDGKTLNITGSKASEDGFGLSFIEINTQTGEEKSTNLESSDGSLEKIVAMVSRELPVYTRISTGLSNNKYYASIGAFGLGGILLEIDTNNYTASTIFTSNDIDENQFKDGIPMIFGNLSSSFISTIPEKKLSATRGISFTDEGSGEEGRPPTVLPPSNCVGAFCVVPGGGGGEPKDKPKKEDEEKKPTVVAPIIKSVNSDGGGGTGNLLQQSAMVKLRANLQAAVKRFVARVPVPLVNAFPYLLFVSLLSLAGYYLFQTQKQLKREDRMRALFEKQKVLAEEKRNFLELTSHYLRTPLTYIKAGSEMLLRNKQNESAATELTESVGHLSLFIESLIEESTANSAAQEIEIPERKARSPLLQKSFWLPVVGLGAALGLFYVIFGVIGGVNFGPAKYVTQLVLLFFIIQLFYGMFKNHRNIVAEEAYLARTINSETELDHTRTKLIKDAGLQLRTRTDHLEGVINKLESADTSKSIMHQGVERLQELAKAFALVGQLEGEVMQGKVQAVSVREMAAQVIEPLTSSFHEKKVKLEVAGFDTDITLTTNKPLAELTLKSLLENALQASKEGATIVVKCLHKDGRIAFQVIDHGEGIPKDKIDRLFKPFVRVGPVTTFNREGIGLSLYLDRLIMHSLGGEVEINSKFKHGTTATVTFNQSTSV